MRPIPACTMLLPLLLTGCGGAASDVAKGPVIYECSGTLKKQALISLEGDHRAVIRLDGKARTFGEWNGEARNFTDWPDGKVAVSADKVSFTGTSRANDAEGAKEAKRSLSLDRHSGHLSDSIDLGTEGKFTFEATCTPRPSAPAI